MKFFHYLLACVLAGCMALAQAAPDKSADADGGDPIARFASPGEEAVGDLLLQAMSLLGVAYRFGGNSPESGLDCSGFIQYVFKKSLHVNLPRTAAEMAQVGREIGQDELKPGDLVFFNTRGFRYSHVGIYLGNSKFIHSPRTGKNIQVANMSQSYWVSRYNGARRVTRGAQLAEAPVSSVAEKPASSSRKKVVTSSRKKRSSEAVASKSGKSAKSPSKKKRVVKKRS